MVKINAFSERWLTVSIFHTSSINVNESLITAAEALAECFILCLVDGVSIFSTGEVCKSTRVSELIGAAESNFKVGALLIARLLVVDAPESFVVIEMGDFS